MAQAKANDCLTAMLNAINSITAFQNKVIFAYNSEDLIDKLHGLTQYPGIGVIYEGMHSQPSEGKSAHTGVSGLLILSVVLLDNGPAPYRNDAIQVNALTYLDQIRSSIIGTYSPTGHFWQFLAEAPVELKAGMVFWIQRWATPIQFPPN